VSSKITEEMSHSTEIALILLSVTVLSLVIFYAYRIFIRKAVIPACDDEPTTAMARMITNKFYIDEIYAFLFEKPFGSLSNFLFKTVETNILNPIVDGVGELTDVLGTLTRRLQRGNMSFYFFAMVAGILLFIIFILII
jgi:NADH-quinone oxidoreductase subunit L